MDYSTGTCAAALARQRVVRPAIQQSPESLNQLADHQPKNEIEALHSPGQSRRNCLRRVSLEDVASEGSQNERSTVLPNYHNQGTLAIVERDPRTDDTVGWEAEPKSLRPVHE